jgi:hypothetical protein
MTNTGGMHVLSLVETGPKPLRKEFGTCALANRPGGTFQVLIVINGSWDEENTPVLQTRDTFYCAEFQRRNPQV